MRLRRHVEPSTNASGSRGTGSRGKGWRRIARDLGVVAGVFVVGYIVSAIWISPTPLFGAGDHVVPHLFGVSEAEARDQLDALGFRTRRAGDRPHPTIPMGQVVWHDPPPGVVLSPNSVVTLTLSAGPAPVLVPDVIGLETTLASRILTAAGVSVGDVTFVSGGTEAGIVIATRPATGVVRQRDGEVDLIVSRGPKERR